MTAHDPRQRLPDSPATARLRRTSEATHLVFADPASRAFEDRLARLAPTDATVLILGETGTGKEVAARELHVRSGRTGPFLAINCGALTESLAEAELFGHEKGAFTGAIRAQAGWFEAARGGTLLLDEIGELPLSLQAKLLRVLQERQVSRVGSRVLVAIDTRIVAATNVDLNAAVAEGRFRQDLLYRLAVATVTLRPLRQRRQDIEPLARHFLALYAARFGRPVPAFSAEAVAGLLDYAWPGNVRELDNVIHRAVLLTAGDVIGLRDLLFDEEGRGAPPQAAAAAPREVEYALTQLAESWIAGREPNLFGRVMSTLVQVGYRAAGNNQVRAAELLGITRNTLRTHLSHAGLAPRRPSTRDISSWVRLRVAVQKFGTVALLRLSGELERKLAARRILVDWCEFETGPALLEALVRGEVDIGSTGEVAPIFAQASGLAFMYVAWEPAPATSVALVVRDNSTVKSVADLRGRTLGFTEKTNVHLLVLRALQRHGLSMAEVQPVLSPPGVPSGPLSVDAEAWGMWDPHLSQIQAQGQFRVLVDGTGLVTNHRFYLATQHLVATMPDVIHAVMQEAERAVTEAAKAPEATARLFAGTFGMASDDVELAVRRLAIAPRMLDEAIVQAQQSIADDLRESGILSRAVRVADIVWRI